jgi:hypothetical protein
VFGLNQKKTKVVFHVLISHSLKQGLSLENFLATHHMSHAAHLLTKMMTRQHFWLLGAKPVAAFAAHAGLLARSREPLAPLQRKPCKPRVQTSTAIAHPRRVKLNVRGLAPCPIAGVFW